MSISVHPNISPSLVVNRSLTMIHRFVLLSLPLSFSFFSLLSSSDDRISLLPFQQKNFFFFLVEDENKHLSSFSLLVFSPH